MEAGVEDKMVYLISHDPYMHFAASLQALAKRGYQKSSVRIVEPVSGSSAGKPYGKDASPTDFGEDRDKRRDSPDGLGEVVDVRG